MLPKWSPRTLFPNLDPELAKELGDDYTYNIPTPTVKKGTLTVVGVPSQEMRQVYCNSLCVKKPDTVCKCNSVITTLVGEPEGDQIQIVECGKCRTSYLMRTRKDENGEVKITAKIWDVSRNLKNFVQQIENDNYDFLVKFNKKEK